MRLIDADAFVKANKDIIDNNIDTNRYEVTLRELINEAPTVERPHGEWIPCSEKLPEHGGFFLITNIDELVRLDFFRKSTNDFDNYSAIAWKPLPEPYIGGEAE